MTSERFSSSNAAVSPAGPAPMIRALRGFNPPAPGPRPACFPRRKASFLARSYKVRRQRGAFAEEILFHLLEQKILRFFRTKIEPVLVHQHLHVLHPHLPRLFRNVLVDALA